MLELRGDDPERVRRARGARRRDRDRRGAARPGRSCWNRSSVNVQRACTLDPIRAAPKVLLHDHLDGGLRPSTIIELADQTGYDGLPSTDGPS